MQINTNIKIQGKVIAARWCTGEKSAFRTGFALVWDGTNGLSLSRNQAGHRLLAWAEGSGRTTWFYPLSSLVLSLSAHGRCLLEVLLNKGTSCCSETLLVAQNKHLLSQTRSVSRLQKAQTSVQSSVAPGHLCRLPRNSSSFELNTRRTRFAETPEARMTLAVFPRPYSLMP